MTPSTPARRCHVPGVVDILIRLAFDGVGRLKIIEDKAKDRESLAADVVRN